MTEDEFVAKLSGTLQNYTETARAQIPRLLASLPTRATQLDLEVFPSQDGDGFFTIRASVDGPNLYVINKAIDADAWLFDAKYTEDGVDPPIPIVDPFDVDYPVNDIIVDCAAKWLQDVWRSLSDVECPIPVQIIGHDDYGTLTPVVLNLRAGT